MNIKIVVAAHKPYWIPSDDVYIPLQVGSVRNMKIDGFLYDCTGDQISEKNNSFCELTGLYWAWKNLEEDYIGLVHYRRHFVESRIRKSKRSIVNRKTFEQALSHVDLILPMQRHYYIESNYSQYIHAHHEQDLVCTKEIIAELYPDYLLAWDSVMKLTRGHRFNMFVMKRSLLDQYLSWLFSILFELERRLDISSYTGIDTRVFGLVSERLLDIWITHNDIRYIEMPVVNLESQHWPSKILNFLKRKYFPSA